MQIGRKEIVTSYTSSITDVLPSIFNNTEAVIKDEERLYEDSIYKANTNIYPLATYSWNNISETIAGETIRLEDKVKVTSTAVPCIQNKTIVYVLDSYKDTAIPKEAVGQYFKYTGVDTDVDFTTIDVSSPANFEKVVNYRYDDRVPSGSSIYWDFQYVKNSKRLLDGVVYNQTETPSGTTASYTFLVSEYINAIAFFNMECTSIEATLKKQSDDSVIMPTVAISMKDYQGITSSYGWHHRRFNVYKKNALLEAPIAKNVKIEIDFINTNTPPKMGEVIHTRLFDVGKTLNRPQGQKERYDIVTIDSAGRRSIKRYDARKDEIQYNVNIPTAQLEATLGEIEDVLNEDIVVIGDKNIQNLINYCFIGKQPYEIDTSSSHNTYSITVKLLA